MYSFIVSSIKNPNQPNIYIYIYICISKSTKYIQTYIYIYIYIYNLFPLVHHTDFLITQTPSHTHPKPKTLPAWFLKNLLAYVSLSFTAPTCREESFHCASFPLAFWTQTIFDTGFPSAWFLKNLLGYVSLSFTAPT